MRPLLVLIVAFCLVNLAISKPLPEGEEEAANGTEEPKKEEEDQPTEKPAEDAEAGGENEEEGGEKKPEDEGAGDEKPEDDGSDSTKAEDDGSDSTKAEEGGEGSGDKEDGKGEAKNNPIETYNKVIELLDKTTQVDKVDSSYLKAGLIGDLQTYLRNPIIDVIGRIGDYSKIESCFKSMGDDVKKILEDILKSFKSCKDKKESNDQQCSDDRSAGQSKIAQISSTISSCVASKRS